MFGGIAGGYLEGGDYSDGAKVGLIAGIVMLVPFLAFFAIVLGWVLLVSFNVSPFSFLFFLILSLIVGVFYTVGLSVFGGIVGTYIKAEIADPVL